MMLNKLLQFTIINIITICLVTLGFISISYAQSIALSPTDVSVATNQEFNLSVYISTSGANIVGADVIINYDGTKLQVISITEGTLFTSYPLKSATSSQIKISGIDSSFTTPYNGTNGLFATVRLRALSTVDTSETLQIAYTNGSTTDSNLTEQTTTVDLLSSVVNSNVNIAGTADGTTTLPNTALFNPAQTSFILFGISLMGLGIYWSSDILDTARIKVQN